MTAEHTAPTSPPQGPHQQPRWAWWVVGIVVPVAGILVTVLLSNPGSSGDDKSDKGAGVAGSVRSEPTTSSSSASSGRQPASGAPAGRVRFGPAVVDADTTNSGSYIELDTSQPIVSGTDIKGGDIIFGASIGDPNLFVPGSASNLARMPASGAAPTAEECAESVDRNDTYTANVKRGDRFCLRTDEGRVAYLRVVTAPSSGTGKLDVTVWETPDA
ncbi:hypothetical protein OHT57_31955 [Streptomyces sp. NBC_00285]|uniref:hypothetical protein n=1 Tax=Streptomyces sp. NBC_00285 TaxID=2975700 RepID=UPI002E2B76EF|nr:hypothetical protein [Streptomyces sp. NBC_00285]